MNAPIDIQILKDAKGNHAFAVIPYSQYLRLSKQHGPTIPNAVVNKVVNKDRTPIRAWREHLGITQAEVARRLDISQSAYAQQEAKESVRRPTRERIARGIGDSAGATGDLRLETRADTIAERVGRFASRSFVNAELEVSVKCA